MVVIFPYAKKIREGLPSPKNYPYWKELVKILVEEGQEVIQVSPIDEERIEGTKIVTGTLEFDSIETLVSKADYYISIEGFAPHLLTKNRGFVIFGVSDPMLYGYNRNINILKNRKYLKANQTDYWHKEDVNEDAYLTADEVWKIISEVRGCK